MTKLAIVPRPRTGNSKRPVTLSNFIGGLRILTFPGVSKPRCLKTCTIAKVLKSHRTFHRFFYFFFLLLSIFLLFFLLLLLFFFLFFFFWGQTHLSLTQINDPHCGASRLSPTLPLLLGEFNASCHAIDERRLHQNLARGR